jgi:hypothetical protein
VKVDAVRPAAVRYMGFQSTSEGREYTLRVDGQGDEPRLFVLVIPHEAFTSKEARFQDAPDLCFAKLQRELLGENVPTPGSRLVLTSADLAQYRETQTKRTPERKPRPVTPPQGEGV